MTYYVKAATAGKVDFASDLSNINSETGTSSAYDTTSFSFIQQVFNTVYTTDAFLAFETVTVNVNLQAGDHFFFSCFNDLYSSYSFTVSASFTDMCTSISKLAMKDPRSDNFEFVFTSPGNAIINVLDSYANFNVTRSMSFTNIEFRGEHAVATVANAALGTYTHPPLATLPVKKCGVTTEPDGTHTALSFT